MISKTKRNIILSALVQFVVGLGFYYYSDFWYIGLIAIVATSLYTYQTLIVKKPLASYWPKIVVPSLWLFLSYFYLYLVRHINSYTLVFFVPLAILVVAVYGFILHEQVSSQRRFLALDNVISLVLIALLINIASLMQVLWHWPAVLIMAFVWVFAFIIALWWLLPLIGRMEYIAAIWAIVCVEICWVMSRWVVLYQLPRAKLVISQPALIIASLAYSWGGMYYHHKKGTLTRPLLFEYLAVSSIVFILVIVLTKWTTGY